MTQRLINLQGATNFRDLGGYKNILGQEVKWGKIYRADSLSELTNDDLKKLSEMKIIRDYDLRSEYEQEIAPDKKWLGVKKIDAHIYEEGNDNISQEINEKSQLVQTLPLVKTYLGSVYQQSLLKPVAKTAFRKVFKGLLEIEEDQAIVFHCTMGKDRTGMVAALILTGLGVDISTITKDYLLTNSLLHDRFLIQGTDEDELSEMIEKMNVTEADTDSIKGITETLKQSFGGFENYFINELGFNEKDLIELKNKYLK